MKLLDQSLPCACAVHLTASTPDPEAIGKRLLAAKCRAKGKRGKDGGWMLVASHPMWGEAEILYRDDAPKLPPADMLEWTPGLVHADPELLSSSRSAVLVRHAGTHGSVPADRKAMLWFARTVMGDQGTTAYDLQSLLFWMPDALDDELSHDAGLSTRQLYIVHAVRSEAALAKDARHGTWMHSHGLGALGAHEFDVLDADPQLDPSAYDALVGALLDGAGPGDECPITLTAPPAMLVDADEFMGKAKPEWTGLRDHDEDHRAKRVVVCDPAKKRVGGLGGSGKPRPASAFRDAASVQGVALPVAFNAVLADRARASLPFLRRALDEFAHWDLEPIAKLKLETDQGSHEFPWFKLHEISENELDATLLNEPFDIAGLNAGDRRTWPVRRLSSWAVPTPFGMLTPDALHPARMLRQHKPSEFARA